MSLGQRASDGNLPARKFSDMKWLNTGLPSEPYKRDETIQDVLKEYTIVSPCRMHEDILYMKMRETLFWRLKLEEQSR